MSLFTLELNEHSVFEGFNFKDIHLSVEEGQFIGVRGMSGSGKSSLFSICVGLQEPDRGDVRYKENSIYYSDYNYHKEVGIIFQIPALISNLTIENNLKLPIEKHFYQHTEYERNQMLFNEVDFFKLQSVLQQRPANLSNGSASCTAIARALCIQPKLVIWDAPLSFSDPEWEEMIINRFYSLKKMGLSLLFFTHTRSDLEKLSDNILMLDQGTLHEI